MFLIRFKSGATSTVLTTLPHSGFHDDTGDFSSETIKWRDEVFADFRLAIRPP
jgi:hypothetical protein